MSMEQTNTLDVKGQNCPMPVVKTKAAFDELDEAETLEVLATDPGSMNDIEGWAASTDGAELVEQVETTGGDGTVYKHYIRKAE